MVGCEIVMKVLPHKPTSMAPSYMSVLTTGAFAHSQPPRVACESIHRLVAFISQNPHSHAVRTNNRKERKCRSAPPTIPGTPAILSNKMIRNSQFLSERMIPCCRSFWTASAEGPPLAKTSAGIGLSLYPVKKSNNRLTVSKMRQR